MELRRGGVGSQAGARRMDGDSRDGGGGCKDAGSEDYENLPTSASLSTHMTAGAMAGILEHSVMYPVDSVKVRLQETLEKERAHACAYASRAGAAWKQPSATALPLSAAAPPDLLGPTGSWRAQPGRLGVRRVAPSAVRLGPRGQTTPPSRAHEGAPAGAPLRRSRRVPGPGCWRRCRRRGEGRAPLASAVAAGLQTEPAGMALSSLTTSGHAIGGFAVPACRGSHWRARCPSRDEWRQLAAAG